MQVRDIGRDAKCVGAKNHSSYGRWKGSSFQDMAPRNTTVGKSRVKQSRRQEAAEHEDGGKARSDSKDPSPGKSSKSDD